MQSILMFDKAALLLVDMNRAHLDVSLDYLPVAPEESQRVMQNAQPVLQAFREAGLPICYIRTAYRFNPETGEVLDNKSPFWQYQRENPIPGTKKKRTFRAVEGADVTQIMPELTPRAQDIIVTKKRYSGFQGTDLEMALRNLGVETLYVMGINTNNCVLCACFDAFNRDFRVVLLEDCCASMNGTEYHEWAVRQIKAALGWGTTSHEVVAALKASGLKRGETA